jgi:hypothetical protein
MHKSTILEAITVSNRLRDYIDGRFDQYGDAMWGGLALRIIEYVDYNYDFERAAYTASVIAERTNLSYLVFRLNNNVYIVSAERNDGNEPITLERSRSVEDSVYINAITEQADKEMLPPYLVSLWRQELQNKDDRDEIEEAELTAANVQHNRRYGNPSVEVTVNTTDSEEEKLPPVNVPDDGPLARFARSEKGGLFDDPDEEDAIRELQTILVDLGLDVGGTGVDGRYGPRTTQAVKDFQQAATEHLGYDLLNSNGRPDGDAGPKTIPALIEVRRDLAEIQRLVLEVSREQTNDSVYIDLEKSLNMLFEKELYEDDRSDLQSLVDKYTGFLQQFPNAEINRSVEGTPSIINRARQVLDLGTNDNEVDNTINIDTYQVASAERQDALEGDLRNKILLTSESGPDLYIDRSSPMDHTVEYTVGTDGDKQSAEFPDALLDDIDAEVGRRGPEDTSNQNIANVENVVQNLSAEGVVITPEMLEGVSNEDLLEIIRNLYQQAEPLVRKQLNNSIEHIDLNNLYEALITEEISGQEAVELQRLVRNLQLLRDRYYNNQGDMTDNDIIDLDTLLQNNVPDVFKGDDDIDPATWNQAPVDPNEGFEEFTGGNPPEGYKLYIKRGNPAVYRWGRGEEINPQDYDTYMAAQEAANADAAENAPQGTQWPEPYVLEDGSWPEEFQNTNGIIRGSDIVTFAGVDANVRWILLVDTRVLRRVTDINITDDRRYFNVRLRNTSPIADYNEQTISLADYDNLTIALLDLPGFEEIDPADYGNDITDNILAYWKTYKDINETDRFLDATDISQFDLGELREVKSYFEALINAMRQESRNLTINGITRPAPTGRPIDAQSIVKIEDYIRNTIDAAIQQKESEEEELAAAERQQREQQKANNLLQLLSGRTSASEHRQIESIILDISTAEEYNRIDTLFKNLPDNRGKDDLFTWFNSEGLGIGFIRHDMTRIRNHLSSIGVNIQELNEVSQMLQRLNSILGVN